jgi:hypothetical protein
MAFIRVAILLERRQNVAVGIERLGHMRMAERLHDDARIHALGEQQRRARMPQIVKSHIGQLRRGEQRFELPRDVPRLKGVPTALVNTKPRSCQCPPAARRASSWRVRCDRNAVIGTAQFRQGLSEPALNR